MQGCSENLNGLFRLIFFKMAYELDLVGLILLLVSSLFLFVCNQNTNKNSKPVESNQYAKVLDELLQMKYPIGYFSNSKDFVKLVGVSIEGTVMFCIHNTSKVSVSKRIAIENNLQKARWLDHVHIQIYSTHHELYILMRDYVALRSQITIH